MFTFYFLFLAFSRLTNNIVFPNVGNKYINKFNIPLVGEQKINAEIITNNTAKIKLSGLINREGSCKYGIFKDELYVIVNHNLKEILDKFKVRFDTQEYDDINDKLKFTLFIQMLKFKKTLILTRENNF